MDDLFKALRAGTKFKKLSSHRPPSSSIRSSPPSATTAAAPAAAASLDFFRAAAPPSSSFSSSAAWPGGDKRAKKRQRGPSLDASREEAVPVQQLPQQQRRPDAEEAQVGKKGKAKGGKGQMGPGKPNGAAAASTGAAPASVKLFKGQGSERRAGSEEKEEEEEDKEGDGEGGEAGGRRSQGEEDEMRAFRKRMRIVVHGSEAPPCIGSFHEMDAANHIKRVLLRNIESSKWLEPTPIQMQSIPTMIQGRDILASAPTGSGKTAAFVIPTLARLGASKKQEQGPRALLLAPTRELAAQIHREVERLAQGKKLRVGLLSKSLAAVGRASGAKSVLGHFDVMVATPMRLVVVLREGAVDLNSVEVVVLDEADKLFELGKESAAPTATAATDEATDKSFLGQVDEILAACSHPKVQRALFSATLPPAVEELATTVLRDAIKVTVGTKNAGASTIEQRLVFVGREEGKLLAIRQLIREGLRPPVLVFLQSKERARELFHELVYDGVRVDVLHAERTQEQRDAVVRRFRTGEIWVLICTDLVARGLDFKAVNMVVNYDLPQSAVSYIHRIGRTGRAGRRGLAVTLFTEADMAHLRAIANVVKLSGCEVPGWMLSLKKERPKDKRRLEVSAPERRRISTVTGFDKQRANNKKRARVAASKSAS